MYTGSAAIDRESTTAAAGDLDPHQAQGTDRLPIKAAALAWIRAVYPGAGDGQAAVMDIWYTSFMDRKPNLGGRPRESLDGKVRTELIKFIVTPGEKSVLQAAAEIYGVTVSEYVRDWILNESYLLINEGNKAAISAMSASVEEKARALGEEVEVKPVFKKYKVVDEIAEL